ncbi:MAG: restriction endonuclease subunit S [Planctomycetota bacterium]
MTTRTAQLDQIAEVFSGHYEKGAGSDDPAGTHRLVFIASIDPAPDHALIRQSCPRFMPKKAPGRAVLEHGDLLVPARGDRLHIAIIEHPDDRRPLVAASFLHVVRPRADDLDPYYLRWWIEFGARERLQQGIQGSNIPTLSIKVLRTVAVPIPPLDIQRRIAEFHALTVRESQIMTDLRDTRSQLNNALALQVATGAVHA